MARVLIGTSGWHYDSWRGPFFPTGLPLKEQLQFYASQFPSAELNGVFYRTPHGKRSKAGVRGPGKTLCSRGRRRSLSSIGKDCRKALPTASNSLKTGFLCSKARSD